tara:strand:+ start:63 stop:782 length:720 start_codon:yes stop_codon:yes gene_type:complete
MYNSIANNHFSQAALGRGGDSMFRLVDGEMSHVNPVEASMIDAFGEKGEEAVKERGSGTINPYTGKREYVIDPITLGTLGLSLYQGWKSTDMQRESAGIQQELVGKQLTELDKTQKAASESKSAQTALAQGEFQQDLQNQADEIGSTKEDLQKNYEAQVEKSGLVSGDADQNKSQMWDRLSQAFTKGKQSLYGKLGQKMGGIEEWYAGEMGRISADRDKLHQEQRVLKQQEKQKFLGIF